MARRREAGIRLTRRQPDEEGRSADRKSSTLARKVRDSIQKNRSKLLPDPKAVAARDVIAAAGA